MTASDKDKSKPKKITATAAGAAALAGAVSHVAHAQGSGKIKIGLLGCGGRGNGALRQCLNGTRTTLRLHFPIAPEMRTYPVVAMKCY